MDIKYIGMDVHKEAIAIAVMNGEGKLVRCRTDLEQNPKKGEPRPRLFEPDSSMQRRSAPT